MFSLDISLSAFPLRFEFGIIAISLSALITADLILSDFESSLLGQMFLHTKCPTVFFLHLKELCLHFQDIGLCFPFYLLWKEEKKQLGHL